MTEQAEHPENGLLIDRYNRRLDYLRVSITDKCNFRCVYCMTHEPFQKLSHGDILRYEEILRIVRVGIEHGIRKVRITGGEPLIRRGLIDFLTELSSYQGIKDLALTTNGLLLENMAEDLKKAGLKRLNISLDSLKPDRFKAITGVDGHSTVWNSILLARDLGFSPIKINVVAMRGVNDDEISDFAALTFDYPFHIRFIEYMPVGRPDRASGDPPLLTPEIRKRVSGLAPLFPVEAKDGDGPARRFRFEGALGEVGFISPVSEHFCKTCNRIRLTAAGQLRPCLLSDTSIDVAGLLRKGYSDERLFDLFRQAADMKHERHRIGAGDLVKDRVLTGMSSIGG